MTVQLDRPELVEQFRRANRAALADPSLLAHYLSGSFEQRAHTRLIASELRSMMGGHTRRLMIKVPPQTGKSTLAAIWGPMWWLANRPHDRVIIASYGQSLAVTRGRAIRKLVQEHGWRWGMQLEPGSAAMHDWELTTGGGVLSVGVGSGVTGRSGDVIFVDDPVKGRSDADSALIRDRVHDWWSADLISRLAPGAPLCMLLTPWHPDDISHRVIEQDGLAEDGGLWRVLQAPAFATSLDDPLGREIGDPLTHPKISADDLDGARAHWEGRRAQTSVRDWNALYMLDPQPAEGALIDSVTLRDRRHTPPPATPVKAAVAVDPSGGGRDAAGVIGGWLGDDQRLYITHDETRVGPSSEWSRAAVLLAAELDAEFIVVETNYGGDMARNVIRSAWDTAQREHPGDERFQRIAPHVKTVNAKKGKMLRAEPIAQQMQDDRVRFGAHLPELAHEWSSWQPTDPDSPGRIDASVYLAFFLLPVPGQQALMSTPTGQRRDQVAPRGGTARIQRRR